MGRSSFTYQERESPDNQRLSRPGLAGKDIEASLQFQGQVIDDGVVPDS